jgi:hypothetical protein
VAPRSIDCLTTDQHTDQTVHRILTDGSEQEAFAVFGDKSVNKHLADDLEVMMHILMRIHVERYRQLHSDAVLVIFYDELVAVFFPDVVVVM